MPMSTAQMCTRLSKFWYAGRQHIYCRSPLQPDRRCRSAPRKVMLRRWPTLLSLVHVLLEIGINGIVTPVIVRLVCLVSSSGTIFFHKRGHVLLCSVHIIWSPNDDNILPM